jgi:sugar/nucleoside kinase (ribokinase family)
MTTRILRGPVTCVGVHILDILGRPVSEIPPGQHSVLIEEIRVTAAGTAAGTSVDLAKLGVGVRNVGAIGDDVLGDFVLRLHDDYGVDTRLITRFESTRTSATMLPIRPNGERPALHMQGANGDFTAAHLTADQLSAITGAALVHLGGIDAMTNLDPGSVGEWAASAKKNGALITMDVLRNGDSRTLEALEPILRHTDWFCPNDEQLQTLTGENDIGKAARRVLAMGAGGIAVTQGEKGCRLIDGEIRPRRSSRRHHGLRRRFRRRIHHRAPRGPLARPVGLGGDGLREPRRDRSRFGRRHRRSRSGGIDTEWARQR